MENKDAILNALNDFEENPKVEIPPTLEQYLVHIAKTGEIIFPWPKLQPLFSQKLDNVMTKFNSDCPTESLPSSKNAEKVQFEEMRTRLLDQLKSFTGAPFTIQRLCELVVDPKKQYKRTDKFLRGIERNVLVVSTVDTHGRKVVREKEPASTPLVNGMDVNGESSSPHPPTNTTPHSWATGQITSSWPNAETSNSGDDYPSQSPSKRARLSEESEDDSKNDTNAQSSEPERLTESMSTECLASTSTSDVSLSWSEETDGPTSSTSSSPSTATATATSSTESLPEQAPNMSQTEAVPEPGQSEADMTPSQPDVSQSNTDVSQTGATQEHTSDVSQSKDTPEHTTSQSQSQAVTSSDSDDKHSDQPSEDNALETSDSVISRCPDASAFETGDSMGFETANLKHVGYLDSGDNPSCKQSKSELKTVESSSCDASTVSETGVSDVSSSDVLKSSAHPSQGDSEISRTEKGQADTSSDNSASVKEADSEPMDAE